jgi:nitrate reductase beta subunit
LRILSNIFGNPDLPEIDDYYEPFDYDYEHLHCTGFQASASSTSALAGNRQAYGENQLGP